MKIIKFSAIWCPGCLVMRPIWNKIEEKYNNIELIEYDYDVNEEEVNKWNIGNLLPVSIILDDNMNELDRLIGEKSLDDIIKVIDKYEKN